ncbi:MAG: hypothetical protein WC882_05295 [Candidatus Gracilibacteria bacterium]
MSNQAHSRYHGMTMANQTRPKSSQAKRRNKAKARVRKAAIIASRKDS